MTVVEGWFAGKKWDRVPPKESMSAHMLELLQMNCAMNSKAFLVEHEGKPTEFVGNRTECALLVMLSKLDMDYAATREEKCTKQVSMELPVLLLLMLLQFRTQPHLGCCLAGGPKDVVGSRQFNLAWNLLALSAQTSVNFKASSA
jgi:hypothetical protein